MSNLRKYVIFLVLFILFFNSIFAANVYAKDAAVFTNTATFTTDFYGTYSDTEALEDSIKLASTSGGIDDYTKLLLHNNGANGATNLTDSSIINKAITVNGNTVVTTAQYKFGAASGLFDGDGDYLAIPTSTDFNLDGVEGTIDCWIRTSVAGFGIIYIDRNNEAGGSTLLTGDGSGHIYFNNTNGSANQTITGTVNVADGNWHHVAIVKQGAVVKLYVDGAQDGQTLNTTFWAINTNARYIGGRPINSNMFTGNIDEFRFSKGIARWTSNFTPPTEVYMQDSYTKLLLHFEGGITDSSQSSRHQVTANGNAQIDVAQYKFGGASGISDGVQDYLSIPDSSDWQFGTDVFTIDFWVRFKTIKNGENGFCGRYDGTNGSYTFEYVISGGIGCFRGYYNSTTMLFNIQSLANLSTDRWYHIAFVRKDTNTIEVFVDGISQGTSALYNTTVNGKSTALVIFDYRANSTNCMDGHLDEFRISKGIARWTSDFTPPSSEYRSSNYPTNGTYTHNEIDISPAVAANQLSITYTKTTPDNTSLSVDYRVYNGSTWGDWQLDAVCGDLIIPNGTNLTGYKVQWRANLSTSDSAVTPSLDEVTISNASLVHVTGVNLNKTTTNISESHSETLIATITPANASNKNITWTSSNDSVAEVSTDGIVTGIGAGTATITATTQDGSYTDTCTVTVYHQAVTSIILNKTVINMTAGMTEALVPTILPADASNKTVTWTTTNPGVATVDNNGTVTGLGAGTAIITATTVDGGFTASCDVNVRLQTTYTYQYQYDPNGSLIRITITD